MTDDDILAYEQWLEDTNSEHAPSKVKRSRLAEEARIDGRDQHAEEVEECEGLAVELARRVLVTF